MSFKILNILCTGSLSILFTLCACQTKKNSGFSPVFGPKPSPNPLMSAGPEYRFGVIPFSDSASVFSVFNPMFIELNRVAHGFTVRYESSSDFSGFDAKLHSGELDFSLVNPYQAVQLEKKNLYRIFGKMGDDDRMRGVIIIRKDSGVRTVKDLKGQVISFPGRTAFVTTMMNKLYLKEQGLDVDREARPQYVGSLESAVMNVFHGLALAGGAWVPNLEIIGEKRPDVKEALEIKWRTPSMPSVPFIAKVGIPQDHTRQIVEFLVHLHLSKEGREILKKMHISKYEPATSATYDPVKKFLEKYKREFGALPGAYQ